MSSASNGLFGPHGGVFVGRHAERRAIATAVTDAREGRPWVVSIEGPAGVGKTALVRQVRAELPAEFVVQRLSGDESADEVPFSTLMTRFPVETTSPFAAGMDLLAVLADLQRDGPVALVIEDLHWVDAASRQALLTAARRLDRDRVIILVTTRDDEEPLDDGWHRVQADPARCHRLKLGPLSWQDCVEWGDHQGVHLDRTSAQRLVRHTGGHPLYVRTLLGELTPDQLTAPTADLPVPRSLAAAVLARIAGLSAPASSLVQALAVLDGRASLLTLGEVAGIDAPVDALDDAMATGFVERADAVTPNVVAFSHPLYRRAVYDDLSMRRRRELHLAAAAVSDPATSLVHRVAASDRRDQALVDELDAAAVAALGSGNRPLAVRHLLAASELAEERRDREQHLLQAALVLIEGGQNRAAGELHDRVEQCADGPLRSQVLGLVAAHAGDMRGAERLLAAAAGSSEASVAAEAMLQLGSVHAAHSRGQDAIDVARRALSSDALPHRARRQAGMVLAVGTAQVHGAVEGLAVLDEQFADDESLTAEMESLVTGTRGLLEFYAGRVGDAVSSLRRVVEHAEHGVMTIHVTRVLSLYAMSLEAQGRWDEALVHANTAVSLAGDEGQLIVLAHAHGAAASIHAGRGAWDDAQRHADAATAAADQVGSPEAELSARLAVGALARARADAGGVVEALAPLDRGRRDNDVPMFAWLWWPPLVGALIDAGHLDVAAESLTRLETVTQARSVDVSMRTTFLRGRLALARDRPDVARRDLERAIALIGRHDPALEQALLRVEYGSLLISLGERTDGIEALRRGRDDLTALGAAPYLERVDHLGQTTDTPALGASNGAVQQLSERERDVVSLVAKGYTNREVAAALFVSSKAVEYHLGHVFAKLHITSRHQLRGLIP